MWRGGRGGGRFGRGDDDGGEASFVVVGFDHLCEANRPTSGLRYTIGTGRATSPKCWRTSIRKRWRCNLVPFAIAYSAHCLMEVSSAPAVPLDSVGTATANSKRRSDRRIRETTARNSSVTASRSIRTRPSRSHSMAIIVPRCTVVRTCVQAAKDDAPFALLPAGHRPFLRLDDGACDAVRDLEWRMRWGWFRRAYYYCPMYVWRCYAIRPSDFFCLVQRGMYL